MKPLVIIDNFLDENELKYILHHVHILKWKYGQRSNPNTIPFWDSYFENEKTIIEICLPKIEKMMNGKFEIERLYANGQTYGQDGTFHTDHESNDRYTFILYMSSIFPSNVDIIGGFTQFKINNQIVNVQPYQNRICVFKSNIVHCGLAPSRESDMLRVSIVFKLKCK